MKIKKENQRIQKMINSVLKKDTPEKPKISV